MPPLSIRGRCAGSPVTAASQAATARKPGFFMPARIGARRIWKTILSASPQPSCTPLANWAVRPRKTGPRTAGVTPTPSRRLTRAAPGVQILAWDFAETGSTAAKSRVPGSAAGRSPNMCCVRSRNADGRPLPATWPARCRAPSAPLDKRLPSRPPKPCWQPRCDPRPDRSAVSHCFLEKHSFGLSENRLRARWPRPEPHSGPGHAIG